MFRHLVRGDGEFGSDQGIYDEYMAVADVEADFFLETVEHVFRRHSLPRGLMTWKDRPVRPEAIRTVGLMTVEGELDDISAPAQTEAAHVICPNIPETLRDHLLQPKVGHYGIFNGRRWRQQICPRIGEFMRRTQAGEKTDVA